VAENSQAGNRLSVWLHGWMVTCLDSDEMHFSFIEIIYVRKLHYDICWWVCGIGVGVRHMLFVTVLRYLLVGL